MSMNSAQTESAELERRPPQPPTLIVLATLILALAVVYVPKLLVENTAGASSTEGFTYVVDLDYWRRTDREGVVRSNTRFDLDHDLQEIPLTIGPWQGQDKPETNREVEILLEPEQYVRRLYRHRDGEYMWLSLIGGRSSQPFHPPDICYDADGWQYHMGSRGFALANGGEIHGLWLDAEKKMDEAGNMDRHVVSYFYIFPNTDRSLSDGIVLFKLTSNRIGTIEESLLIHEDFIRQFFIKAQE